MAKNTESEASTDENGNSNGLTARRLACRRGERQVFAGLDFAAAPGEALVLRGPNGSGKSSLLRLLAGLLAPTEGAVEWAGSPVSEDPVAHARRLVFIGHLDPVKLALTASENLSSLAALVGERAAVDAALDRFGLLPQRDLPARVLSAGQRRRLNLARLAVGERPLWLLDEPTVALDSAAVSALHAVIASHLGEGGIAVIATHDALALPSARTLELNP